MSTMDRDALDRFLEERDRLPQWCPSWCHESHSQALEEGCGVEDSSRHYGPEFYAPRRPAPKQLEFQLIADHGPTRRLYEPMVTLRIQEVGEQPLRAVEMTLNTGEVRVVAQQLLHLADLADLDDR